MLPARNHSFDRQEDEHYSHYQHERQRSYHDSPPHGTTYMSSPPDPPSPVSLSHAPPYTLHPTRVSADISREPSPQRYSDRSPSPPPPPPHRSSLSRHSRRESPVRRQVAGGTIPMEDFIRPAQDNRSREHVLPERQYTPSERSYNAGNNERRVPPTSFPQGQYPANASPIPGPYLQRPTSRLHDQSYASNLPLATGAATPGTMTPGSFDVRSSHYSSHSLGANEYSPSQPYRMSDYGYSPYHNSSNNIDPTVSNASINPQYIVDDGDDDFMPRAKNQSYPMQQPGGLNKSDATIAVGAAGPTTGIVGGLFNRQPKDYTASGTYRPVENAVEKSSWLTNENKKRKRNSWLCGIGIGVVIIAALAAGVIGGVYGTRSHGKPDSTNNANDDTSQNGDLDINSAEIKALMNNPNLHKVFPGVDYTPWGVQYPLCMTYPPSQNNVTRDVAVLSQLTNTIRLYGTDCNQTEMVLHALDKLKLTNMKVWLGVWVDTNTTTTDRQLKQMYKILSEVKSTSIFKGAIIGNEALYRAGEDKAQSKAELIQLLTQVKSNFTSLGYDLPVATSDLGDNWDASLVAVVDYVMSNIHPFFAGVSAEQAASWTWTFWNQHDVSLTASTSNVKQIISETGWPSSGGTDCGGTTGDCTTGQSGATANVTSMNTFMADWVCQALTNGTDYFWFEAFDEPWKVQYNTAGKEWEDKWGLMDAGRNLKPGIKIPNCGGKTVS